MVVRVGGSCGRPFMRRASWPEAESVASWSGLLDPVDTCFVAAAGSGTREPYDSHEASPYSPEALRRLSAAAARGARLEFWTGRRLGRHLDESGVDQVAWRRERPAVDAPRLAWWPHGKLADSGDSAAPPPLVGFASSRLPRALDGVPEVFWRLRKAVDDLGASGALAVLVAGLAASEPVRRAVERARVPRLEVAVADERMPLRKWLNERLLGPEDLSACPSAGECRLELSPPLGDAATWDLGELARTPAADRVLLAVADRLELLSLRPGGNWGRLLDQAARWSADVAPVVRRRDLETPSGGRAGKDATEPTPAFAAAWISESSGEEAFSVSRRIVAPDELSADEWLVHFTRRCDGPWPGQSADEYWDELLDDRPEKDRSAEAVLRRLLREERLRGSSRAIRGGAAVVCFTATPLVELGGRRTWRRHRRRWDFEPYGVAICRERLARRGARPVTYGDERTWRELADEERPFFQLCGGSIDWREEREWRAPGDVDLRELDDDQVVVFVPERAAAARFGVACRFRLAILSDS